MTKSRAGFATEFEKDPVWDFCDKEQLKCRCMQISNVSSRPSSEAFFGSKPKLLLDWGGFFHKTATHVGRKIRMDMRILFRFSVVKHVQYIYSRPTLS